MGLTMGMVEARQSTRARAHANEGLCIYIYKAITFTSPPLQPLAQATSGNPQSLYPGVYWKAYAGRWGAEYQKGGVKHFLGYFDKDRDAFETIMRFKTTGVKPVSAFTTLFSCHLPLPAPPTHSPCDCHHHYRHCHCHPHPHPHPHRHYNLSLRNLGRSVSQCPQTHRFVVNRI